jgi:hypothetical protein
MPIDPGTARWCRLLLAIVLVVLVGLAAGATVDDIWVAGLSDSPEGGDDLSRATSDEAVSAAPDVPTPDRIRGPGVPATDDRVAAAWTSLTPTDRAPPRA